jgi:nucleoid-associated protein YgaU
MGRVEFWLSYDNGTERIQLPVNPSTIAITSPFGFEDVEVSQLGEIQIIKERGLKEVSLSSFFPKYYNSSFCEYTNIPDPQTAIQQIEKWRDTRLPIRLNITGTDVNIPVTIRDFSYEKERAGSPEDIYFDMTLKEFRFLTFRTISDSTNPGDSPTQRPGSSSLPSTYTVKKNDCLWGIARSLYGDATKWKKIYDANVAKIGKNPNLIKPGQVLVIPSA